TQLSKEAKKAEAERRRKLRQDEKNVQQQRQLDEMKRLPLEAIQLTPDGNDVLKIGSVVWDDVGLNYRLDYLKVKNIKYGRNRSKDALGPLIVNFLKAQPYKNAVSNSRRSSASSTGPISSSIQKGNGLVVRKGTKPDFLPIDEDGTMFRLANVLKKHKECYVATKRPLDRAELDRGGLAHAVEWNTLTNTYNKAVDHSDPDDDIDLIQGYADLEVFGIDPMAASEHVHPLTTEQIMQLVGYMEHHYQKTHEKCTKSGEHELFLDYINGVLWLGYLFCTFKSVGDKSMHNTAFAELPDNVMNESANGRPGARKRGGSIGSRSVSPVPPGSNRKQTSAIAIQGAAAALDDRMSDLRRSENFNTMMKLTEERDAAEEDLEELDGQLVMVKARRKEAKREGEEFAEEAEYQRLKKKCKKAHAKFDRLVQEVERLEKLLGY
ncbi:hypothetical protein ACHAXN_006902, partial [Cyclotella atomus]